MKVLQKSSPILATIFVFGLFLLPQLVPAEDLTNGVYLSVMSSSGTSSFINLSTPVSLLGQVNLAHKFNSHQELRVGLRFYSTDYPIISDVKTSWGVNAEDIFYLGHQFIRPFLGFGVGVNDVMYAPPLTQNPSFNVYVPGGLSFSPTEYLSVGLYSNFGYAVAFSNTWQLQFWGVEFSPIQTFVAFWF